MTLRAQVLAASLSIACAPALRSPAPMEKLGAPAAREGRSAVELVAEARASFARRPAPEAVRRAESLFLAAADADPTGVDGLAGAIAVRIWRGEHEGDPRARADLAASAVELGQWCERRAPASATCAYELALALGQQARERPSTATEGLKTMVARLRRAAAAEPGLDEAGPERVLALVLLRAPAWPVGPGDRESGLAEARRAASRAPDHAPNQLALAEALLANGDAARGHAAARRGVELARAAAARGEPDAQGWIAEGELLAARPAAVYESP